VGRGSPGTPVVLTAVSPGVSHPRGRARRNNSAPDIERGATREQVVTNRENRVADGQDGTFAATPGRNPMIQG